MAPREVFSVTPFLYAFKRWFTFSSRTSALLDILTTAQRYELFLKYAIGKSLFVLHTAVVKYRIVIQVMNSNTPSRGPSPDKNNGRFAADFFFSHAPNRHL